MKTIMAVLLIVMTALLLSAPTQAQEGGYGYSYSEPRFQEWQSETELRAWLKQDLTDEREYQVDVYDCENFAMDLALSAAQDGYYIGLRATLFNKQWHMDNFAVVSNHVYKINPQNDYCVKWEVLD